MKPQLDANFEWIDAAGGRALACRPLAAHASHLFTTRAWALGSARAADDVVAWSAVAEALDVPETHLIRMRQVHGASVVVKRAGTRSDCRDRPSADIIISDDPAVAIAIQTADCVPLLIVDARLGAVAAAHAGWRGLAANAPGVTVRSMIDQFGSDPRSLVVAIGPSISAARYEVGDEVRARFESAFDGESIARWFPRATRPAHWQCDGWTAAADQLQAAGVPRESIFASKLCTAEHRDLFCSYRRDGTQAGRMAAAIRARARAE